MRHTPDTPWQAGAFRGHTPHLLFGQMYEDAAVELAAFPPRSRVFCIAAAGCTARALAAAGHEVTAVDINPRQIQYAEERAAGGPAQNGLAEQLLALGRKTLPLFGWTEGRLREFLTMTDTAEQLQQWRRVLDNARWRAATEVLLWSRLLRVCYASSLVASLPPRFAACLRQRLERGWATHANRYNPYAWQLLLGEAAPGLPMAGADARPIRFICADAAHYLESCAAASFDAFSLSNIVDGAPAPYIERLFRAVRHAGAPGAIRVVRSFAEPALGGEDWAARDRSLLWGTVDVARLEGN